MRLILVALLISMQYLHNRFSGAPKLEPLGNNGYSLIRWTTVQEVQAAR